MTLTWQVKQDGGDCTRRALWNAHKICSSRGNSLNTDEDCRHKRDAKACGHATRSSTFIACQRHRQEGSHREDACNSQLPM
jgi:hypothetical protein